MDDGNDVVAVIIPRGPERGHLRHGCVGAAATAVELYQNPTQGIGDAIVQSVVGQSLLAFNGARAAAVAAQGVATANGDAEGAGAAAQKAAEAFVHRSEGGSQLRSRSPAARRTCKAGARPRRSASPASSWPA